MSPFLAAELALSALAGEPMCRDCGLPLRECYGLWRLRQGLRALHGLLWNPEGSGFLYAARLRLQAAEMAPPFKPSSSFLLASSWCVDAGDRASLGLRDWL